jgi:hypothetical protein
MRPIFLFIFLLVHFFSTAQLPPSKTVAKFIITEAECSGEDVTKQHFDSKACFTFYTTRTGALALAKTSNVSNADVYGTLHTNQKPETLEKTANTYKQDIFRFRWNYFTYEDKSSWATVVLIKTYKPQGVTFTLRIVLTDLKVCEYKGYMEGTLNLD